MQTSKYSMICPDFTDYHLKTVLLQQKVFNPLLVARRLHQESEPYGDLYQQFIIPCVLALERDWLNGEMAAQVLFKVARRLQRLTEEIAISYNAVQPIETHAIIGSFGPIYSTAFSLVKTLLLCRYRTVVDLSTRVDPVDMVITSLQVDSPHLYIAAFGTNELSSLRELTREFRRRKQELSTCFVEGLTVSGLRQLRPHLEGVTYVSTLREIVDLLSIEKKERHTVSCS